MSSGTMAGIRTYKNYVNGEWLGSASGETFPVYDPSTEEVIAQVAAAGATDVDRAVKAARAAFDGGPWATTSAQDRGRVLFKLAEKIRQNAALLAEIECRNTGKPIVEAEYDIADVATCFEYYGGLAHKVPGSVNPRTGEPRAGKRAHLPPPRAGRRRRTDYSVELSAAHGRVETRARACRWLHMHSEAGRTNAADGARIRKLVRGSWLAARRGEYHQRPW